MPAYEDGVFKSIFIRPESKRPLADIISSFIGIPIEDVAVRGGEQPIRDVAVKREIFDISCTATDGKSQFAIEMQANPMENDSAFTDHANLKSRSVYCLADLHSNQSGRGFRYSGLAKSYQITVCRYSPFKTKHTLLEEFMLRNVHGLMLSDAIRSIFVDLSLIKSIIKKPVHTMTAAEMWSIFIAKSGDPMYYGLLNEIIKNREEISMAQQALNSISMDPDERARYHSRRIWEMDREHEKAVWEEGAEAARQEAEAAHREAEEARLENEAAQREAEAARREAEATRLENEAAHREAEAALREAEAARREAEAIRRKSTEKVIEIVRKMLAQGMDISSISRFVEMPEDEIKKLVR